MIFAEKTLICPDCGLGFSLMNSGQKVAGRGYSSDPGRCPLCRAARKIELGSGGGGRSTYGYQAQAQRQMFSATCASCGHNTQVPFEPRNGRPVYCSTCYSRDRR